mgnify:CR=1 FL=1
MHELYPLIGVFIGAASGIIIAIVKTNGRENETIHGLRDEINDLKNRFDTLRTGFELVFDQYSREFEDEPKKMAMLKDLRKVFEQWS